MKTSKIKRVIKNRDFSIVRKKYFFTKNLKNHARKPFFKQKMKLFSKKWKARKALILAALRHFLKPKKSLFQKKTKKIEKKC